MLKYVKVCVILLYLCYNTRAALRRNPFSRKAWLQSIHVHFRQHLWPSQIKWALLYSRWPPWSTPATKGRPVRRRDVPRRLTSWQCLWSRRLRIFWKRESRLPKTAKTLKRSLLLLWKTCGSKVRMSPVHFHSGRLCFLSFLYHHLSGEKLQCQFAIFLLFTTRHPWFPLALCIIAFSILKQYQNDIQSSSIVQCPDGLSPDVLTVSHLSKPAVTI